MLNSVDLNILIMKYSTIRTEFSEKNLIEIKEMDFKNGVINIQAMGYNGARTVNVYKICLFVCSDGNE